MSLLANILDPRCTAIDIDAASRKRALEWISEQAADTHNLDARSIYDEMQARERLGSTGLGEGVAIPHCRTSCDEIIAVFIRLSNPVDFDAPDSEDVDLLFALIVPEEEADRHLTVLAALSEVFSQPENLRALRSAPTDQALRDTLLKRVPDPHK